MKIAFVSANLETGGIERVVNNLSNYLIDKGDDVHIIATKNGKCDYHIDKKIKCHILKHDTSKNKVTRIFSKINEFRNIIKTENIDVLLSFGSYVTMYTVVSSLFLKVNIIGSERTDPRVAPESGFLRKLRNIAYRLTDGMVFQTEQAKSYFSKGIQRKGTVIPNPIKESLPERWEGERKKEVVNFCRLNSQKNLPLLIRAFAKFHNNNPEFKMVIYGEGQLKQELINLAGDLGISEYFEIRDFTPDIHNCILKSYMFVSSSDYEGISNSMLESLGIGLPCICTDCPVGGAGTFIKNHENGLLVPVRDEEKLYQAMEYMANNYEKASEMGRNATKIKALLSVDKIAKLWLNTIKCVVDSDIGVGKYD